MQVTVVSDTICPWCYVGKRNLDQVMAARPDLGIVLEWRAYMLDPSIPPEGVDRKEYLRAKFGDGERPRAMADALRQAGEASGITLAFDKIALTPNTLDCHRLIRWARSVGVQHNLVEALFAAYFTHGRNIGDRQVLAAIANEAGMDGELVEGLLASDADLQAVMREISVAQELGISGVPALVIENKFMVVGAHAPEQLIQIFERARDALTPTAAMG